MAVLKESLIIAKRELGSIVRSPFFFVLCACFVVLAGFFFFSILSQFNSVLQRAALLREAHPSLNDQVIQPYYKLLEAVLLFFVPLLTMRIFAEDRKNGSYELLMTSPLSIPAIVLGKYLAICCAATVLLILTGVYPLALAILSEPEVPPVIAGFLGLVLIGWSLLAVGVAVSSFGANQTFAGIVTLAILLLLHVIDAPSGELSGPIAAVLEYLTPATHAAPLFKGVVSGTELVYFASLAAVGLFVANRALESQRWR
jgi:ABC-2 type transport system permease protein